jgi:hypothetical protein
MFLDVVYPLCFDKKESSYNSLRPFSTYLVGNPDIVPHDRLYPLASRVFVFPDNRTMYLGFKYVFNSSQHLFML